jgi:hypothetical protein
MASAVAFATTFEELIVASITASLVAIAFIIEA